jgi:uncharacterized protein YndB with AHSA1/START domain
VTDRFTTSVRIAAAPETVFPYLTDPALMVRWMGEWADLHPPRAAPSPSTSGATRCGASS